MTLEVMRIIFDALKSNKALMCIYLNINVIDDSQIELIKDLLKVNKTIELVNYNDVDIRGTELFKGRFSNEVLPMSECNYFRSRKIDCFIANNFSTKVESEEYHDNHKFKPSSELCIWGKYLDRIASFFGKQAHIDIAVENNDLFLLNDRFNYVNYYKIHSFYNSNLYYRLQRETYPILISLILISLILKDTSVNKFIKTILSLGLQVAAICNIPSQKDYDKAQNNQQVGIWDMPIEMMESIFSLIGVDEIFKIAARYGHNHEVNSIGEIEENI